MAAIVEITGWETGLKKVSMTRLLQTRGGLQLRDAKALTDKVLDGKTVHITIEDMYDANSLAIELQAIGAIVAVYEQNLGLEDTLFAEWLFQGIVDILNTPLHNDQRIQRTQSFFSVFEEKVHQVPQENHIYILEILDRWQEEGKIQERVWSYNEETKLWLGDIIGTIDGILS